MSQLVRHDRDAIERELIGRIDLSLKTIAFQGPSRHLHQRQRPYCQSRLPRPINTQRVPEMTMRITKTARLLLLSGAATATLTGSALALDAQSFIDRLTTVSAAFGYDFEFGPASLDGDTIVVDGFTLSIDPSGDVAEPMTTDTGRMAASWSRPSPFRTSIPNLPAIRLVA
jgi:hypothetical protein